MAPKDYIAEKNSTNTEKKRERCLVHCGKKKKKEKGEKNKKKEKGTNAVENISREAAQKTIGSGTTSVVRHEGKAHVKKSSAKKSEKQESKRAGTGKCTA